MAPKHDVMCAIKIADRRQGIVNRLQHAINIRIGRVHGAYNIAFYNVSTSFHRNDMQYITLHIIPKLRELLHVGDGQPIPDTFQAMGEIEIEGMHVCDDDATCRCAIRRTLKVKITKRQDANGNQ